LFLFCSVFKERDEKNTENDMYRSFRALETKASSLEEENKTLRDKVDAMQRALGTGKTG